MDKRNDKRKIAIIGPYPPPYGGISVHIQRVLSYLDKLNYDYDFYLENRSQNDDIPIYYKFYGFRKLVSLFILLSKRYVLIHHHSPDWRIRIILSLYAMLGKNVYLHIHGASLKDTIRNGGIKSFLTCNLLKFVNVIADNEDIVRLVKKYNPKSIVRIDAFLPQLYEENIYKEFIEQYGEMLKNKNYVISMVGWFTYYENEDLYGFDIALQALHRFKKEVDEDVLLLASINGVVSEKLHQEIKKYIEKKNLINNVFFIYDDLPQIWPIYIVSNVFIRPSCTDGSPLSIKEAVWFKTPVIASDCVPRPKGVILFKNRSPEDLFKKIKQIYKDRETDQNIKIKIEKLKENKFKYKLFDEIYKLNERGSK